MNVGFRYFVGGKSQFLKSGASGIEVAEYYFQEAEWIAKARRRRSRLQIQQSCRLAPQVSEPMGLGATHTLPASPTSTY